MDRSVQPVTPLHGRLLTDEEVCRRTSEIRAQLRRERLEREARAGSSEQSKRAA
jgi:hypothetical protein